MVLLIDNYDSFSYNLYQSIGLVDSDIRVIKNDELSIEEIEAIDPTHIVISPGPGRPSKSGICKDVIEYFYKKIPILGICLGHQAIYEVFKGTVSYSKELVHGKQDEIEISNDNILLNNLPSRIHVGRYHSLSASKKTLPKELVIIGESCDKEIMAIKHREYELYGLQFHPESILTPKGDKIISNFLSIK